MTSNRKKRTISRWAVALIAIVLTTLACRSTRAVPTSTLHAPSTPTPMPSLSPPPVRPTVPLTPLVTVVTPTPLPTATAIESAQRVREKGPKALARLREQGVEPHCLWWQDTDDDDENEWLALYLDTRGDRPVLAGLVLDGETVHPLDTEGEAGLGDYPTCDVQFEDLTGDAQHEILVFGRTEAQHHRLHLFHWAEGSYQVIGSFEGDAGIWLEDATADLAKDIIVGQRTDSDNLDIQRIYTWDQGGFSQQRERYALHTINRPQTYDLSTPTSSVIYLYLALGDRDVLGAYEFLTPRNQAGRSKDDWRQAFATTLSVEVSQPEMLSETDDQAEVQVQIRAVDNENGQVVARTYHVTWQTQRQGARWLLDQSERTELEEEFLPYYRP